MNPKSKLAPGFLSRLQKICKDRDITLIKLGEIVECDPQLFKFYDSGELDLDEITLHKILDYSGVDWMWLEHGWDEDILRVISELPYNKTLN